MSGDNEESDHVYEFEEDNDDIWTSFSGDQAADHPDVGLKAFRGQKNAKIYDVEAESFSMVDIQHTMRAESANTEQVMLLIGLHVPEIALGLLRKYSWTSAELNPKYPRRPEPIIAFPTFSASHQPLCPICDDRSSTLIYLQCGHKFCSRCWVAYLEGKVNSGDCDIRCMQDGCSWLIPGSFIKELCGDTLHSRFEDRILRRYVEQLPHLKFCPAPECTEVVSCRVAANKSALLTIVPTVTCSNGHTFCFGCHIDSDHRPVLCRIAKLWLDECQNQAQIQPQLTWHKEHLDTLQWINIHTKKCPGCLSSIQKNGGCNHMTCKKCRRQFCWVCLNSWEDHSCNSYVASTRQGPDALPGNSTSPQEMEPFLHYYYRWANHGHSAKLSADLLEIKMKEMQRMGGQTWNDVQFVKEAVENVLKCQRTLRWTYVMAYYLEESNFKAIFEDNQRYLERAVEDFTELLESRIDPVTIGGLLSRIRDKGVYVRMRNEKMLEDTAQGFKEGRWAWKEPPLVYPVRRKAQDKDLDHDSTNLVNASSASDANHTTDQAAHNYINPPRYIRLNRAVLTYLEIHRRRKA